MTLNIFFSFHPIIIESVDGITLFLGILSFLSATSLVQVILVSRVDPGNSLLGCSCPIHCPNGG